LYFAQVHLLVIIGEDPLHPSNELLTPGKYCKGWESSINCIYPQTLIIQFMGIIKLRTIQFLSHQTKIANKIQLLYYTPKTTYPLPKPDQLDDLMFKTIGYFSLGDNVKHKYTARELKSIHLDASVFYLKIVFYGCYLNEYNRDNQVGVLGIHCFGDPAPDINKKKVGAVHEYDRITKERLEQLEEIKNNASAIEDYKRAAKAKNLIKALKSFGEQLAFLESKKAEAIHNEDYITAKILNTEINQIRKSFIMEEEYTALKSQPYINTSTNKENTSEVKPVSQYEVQEFPLTQDLILEDPPIEEPIKKQPIIIPKTPERKITPKVQVLSDEERPIKPKKQSEEIKEERSIEPEKQTEEIKKDLGKKLDIEDKPEPLARKVKELADPYISYIDLSLLEMAFSKTWTFREQAIKILEEEVKSNKFSAILTKDKGQALSAILGLMGYLIMDSVFIVSTKAMKFVELAVNTLTDSVSHIKDYFGGELDSCLSALMDQIGNTNINIRKEAYATFISLPKNPNIDLKTLISHIVSSQNKKTQQSAKHVQEKLKVIHTLFKQYIKKPKDPLIPAIINMAIAGVNNASNHVRTEAYDLFASIHNLIGDNINKYLTDLRQAQKDLLEAKFNVNKPKSQKKVEEAKIIVTTNINPQGGARGGKTKVKKQVIEEDESTERECEYCGKRDPRFNEDSLDLHMYKVCPMLYLCHNCKNVIEITKLNSHLLIECSAAENYEPCSICNQAILRDEIDIHLEESNCKACDPEKAIKCPLCHKDVQPATNDAWKNHILKQKCPGNPRKVI